MNSQYKTIGLIGGMSPFSTSEYYLDIVRMHEQEFGDCSYPRIFIASVSFQEVIDLQHKGDWDGLTKLLQAEFTALERAGAEVYGLCTNTMHRVLPEIRCSGSVVSIHDAVAAHAHEHGVKKIGLTGTRFTMNDSNYRQSLEERGLSVMVPNPESQEEIHRIIYSELVKGVITQESGDIFSAACIKLLDSGADAVLLGCTELRLLPTPVPMLMFDSAALHARALWHASVEKS